MGINESEAFAIFAQSGIFPLYLKEKGIFMKTKTILVIDDDAINIELLKMLLESANYRLLEASNGKEALEIVMDTLPDLILLDVMMPGIDGYETCRIFKQNIRTRMIPIIMVTALKKADHKVKALKAGADDFISKPIDKTELLVRVKSMLRVKSYYDALQESERKYKKIASDLRKSMARIKILSGMLPICAKCKKIRDDKGYWNQIESYIHRHSEAEFSHSVCPDCARKLYPELYENNE